MPSVKSRVHAVRICHAQTPTTTRPTATTRSRPPGHPSTRAVSACCDCSDPVARCPSTNDSGTHPGERHVEGALKCCRRTAPSRQLVVAQCADDARGTEDEKA